MTLAQRRAHRARYGHAYRLKRRPDNGKAYCVTCETTRWSARYANDPEFRDDHNAVALAGKRKSSGTVK